MTALARHPRENREEAPRRFGRSRVRARDAGRADRAARRLSSRWCCGRAGPPRRSRPMRPRCRSPSAACCSTCRRPRSASPMQRHPGAQERARSRIPVAVARAARSDGEARAERDRRRRSTGCSSPSSRSRPRWRRSERVRIDLSALSRRHAVRRAGRAEGDLVQGRHALSGRGPVLRSGRAAGLRRALLAPGRGRHARHVPATSAASRAPT